MFEAESASGLPVSASTVASLFSSLPIAEFTVSFLLIAAEAAASA